MSDRKLFKIEVFPAGIKFDCLENEAILDAALKSEVVLERNCKTGACGVCEAQIISPDSSGYGEKY